MDNPDQGRRIGKAFYDLLERKLVVALEAGESLTAAEITAYRQVLQDNAITLSQIRRGDFGKIAQQAAEEWPDELDTEEGGALQ